MKSFSIKKKHKWGYFVIPKIGYPHVSHLCFLLFHYIYILYSSYIEETKLINSFPKSLTKNLDTAILLQSLCYKNQLILSYKPRFLLFYRHKY